MMQQLPHFPENHSTSAAMASADMTVPEWQRARLRWLQQQQQQQQYYYQSFFTATPTALDLCRPNSTFSVLPAAGTAAFDTSCNAFCDEEGSISVADDLLSNMPPDLIHCPIFGSSFVSGSVDVEGGDEPGMSRFSCPPAVGVVEADQIKATVLPSVTASPFGVRGGAAVAAAAPYQSTVDRGSWESWRKRKAGHEAIAEEPEDDRRVEKVEGTDGYCYLDAMIVPKLETDPPISSDVTTTTTTTANGSDGGKPATGGKSREKYTKVPDPAAKTGYIHVRARRGQATDSHSLAERARREKISKRMKLLQDLVPGCSTITGKAGVLDEIINYVQSLQRQVEFLSMKLAAANPILDSDIDAFLSKEVIMQMVLPHDGAGVLPSSPGSTPSLDVSNFLNHVNSTIMQTQQAVAAPTAVQFCSSTTSLNQVQAVSSSCPGELQDSLLLHPTPRAPPPVAVLSEGCLVVDPAYKVRVTSLPSWEADHLHGHYRV